MNANAAIQPASPAIERTASRAPILIATGPATLAIRAGTIVTIDGRRRAFYDETPIELPELVAGTDYAITLDTAGSPLVAPASTFNPLESGAIAGFHFAPGGNATARAGGDTTPAINPYSLWDLGFRVDAPDPRGMALVDMPDGRRFWVDIYLLGAAHQTDGTSRHGARIADGDSLDRLNYQGACEILASHGKRLMTYDEFRVAASGVTERSSAPRHPKTTGLDAARTSRFGLVQTTGNLWVWGTDGDPDDPRPSVFGGSWFDGSNAGSRYANLGYWPEISSDSIGARGAGDHLSPARAKARAA